MSGSSEPALQHLDLSDAVRAAAELDPLATMPMQARGPVEPTDFLDRLADAMRVSAATIAWLADRVQGPKTDD